MSTTELILLLYVLPMIIVAVGIFLDEDTKNLGDWFDDCGYALVPIINILLSVILITLFLMERFKIRERWDKLRNIKLRD